MSPQMQHLGPHGTSREVGLPHLRPPSIPSSPGEPSGWVPKAKSSFQGSVRLEASSENPVEDSPLGGAGPEAPGSATWPKEDPDSSCHFQEEADGHLQQGIALLTHLDAP